MLSAYILAEHRLVTLCCGSVLCFRFVVENVVQQIHNKPQFWSLSISRVWFHSSLPMDNVWAMVIVWRFRGKIIRTAPAVLCCVRQLCRMVCKWNIWAVYCIKLTDQLKSGNSRRVCVCVCAYRMRKLLFSYKDRTVREITSAHRWGATNALGMQAM